MHWSKQHDLDYRKSEGAMSAQESEKIKNDFDKRIHALDTYKNILSKIAGLDYRFPGKIKNEDGTINYSEANNFDEEAASKNTRNSTISDEAKLTSEIEEEKGGDDLTVQ